MIRSRIFVLLAAVLLFSAIAGDVTADISNAAVLYLRIAPGARAAGMGEAYVAITDDATATHWNPAGLGAYPLADAWIETEIPRQFRPLKGMAALKSGGAADYMAYEIWALSPRGLVRFDNENWYLHEKFTTKTDQTVEKILASYFNVTDEQRLATMIERVAYVNNKRAFTYLDSLRERVMANVSTDYSGLESLTSLFDSLLLAYNECRVNWNQVENIERRLKDGLKDNQVSEVEADRISIAVEKSHSRFIKEELTVPYSVNYTGEPSAIAVSGADLLVGTNNGLMVYNANSNRWRTFTVADGLPSDTVTSLFAVQGQTYVGTSGGPARFFGQRVAPVDGADQLPEGVVQALGGRSQNDLWMVLGNDLYHFDGRKWSNSMDYSVALDDTPESIARRFALYNTPAEFQGYLEKFRAANEATDGIGMVDPIGSGGLDIMSMVAEGNAGNPGDTTQVADTLFSDSADVVGAESETTTETVSDADTTTGGLLPGNIVKAPYLNEVKGKVNAIYGGPNNRVWIGTDYGLLYFDGSSWSMPGYRDYTMKAGETFDELVDVRQHADADTRATYAALITDINDLDEDPIAPGRRVKMYRNPAAAKINTIVRTGERLFFATDVGLIAYDGYYWERANIKGLDRKATTAMYAVDEELWLMGEDKLVIKANALQQITLMHVKWLPELTDDVYYEFVSFVTSSREWGTFGGNITFISYGKFLRTNEAADTLGSFDSFDISFTGSYGTALTSRLKVGLSAKILYSKLSDLGAGLEKGKGTSGGFAVDFGLLYMVSHRLTLGMALTNLGPKMAYIDAAQADDLPRNLAIGFGYDLLQAEYYRLLVTAEVNKILVGMDDGLSEELKQLILNVGAEFLYAKMFAIRGGYIYDDEGDVKTMTLGVGLSLFEKLKFDFSYIPSGSTESLRNTLRVSLAVLW